MYYTQEELNQKIQNTKQTIAPLINHKNEYYKDIINEFGIADKSMYDKVYELIQPQLDELNNELNIVIIDMKELNNEISYFKKLSEVKYEGSDTPLHIANYIESLVNQVNKYKILLKSYKDLYALCIVGISTISKIKKLINIAYSKHHESSLQGQIILQQSKKINKQVRNSRTMKKLLQTLKKLSKNVYIASKSSESSKNVYTGGNTRRHRKYKR